MASECFDFLQHPPQFSLSSEQIQYCNDALENLKKKWEHPDVMELEFKHLEARSMKESDVEERKEELCKVAISVNHEKNRYINVLPFDSNRVVLTAGDYINASFVKSPAELAPQFIATQGPSPDTFEDFWEMVLQYRCTVIVMLTRLVENEKLKCGDYFQAENGPSELGNISIVTKCIKTTSSSLVIRHLEVTKAESNEPPLSVMHIQYLEWPDHGTPTHSLPVREIFRRTFHLPPNVRPILVHCSAGIGRTGTYCTIHATIQRILAGDEFALNLDATVEAFRSQRAGMVQSLEQYKFCYKAVIEELEELVSGRNNS
ncbi:hypothetical protein SOVF_121410 [Spinacia oleracea]|uniref:protein-tyrosine-phosphatase n=1 Tax=Spinacia oleracea TaxID=3562 RepID=A0A9R0JVU3_SPIOL|nr:protein-tyrosine-phosphatase PTP1-like [Spinacia oleracea]KNA12904.1 hypothetical protein SOVF_121410 [Spinacia oleracea]